MSKSEIQQKQQQLAHLQQESRGVAAQIAVQCDSLLEEFDRAYPPLSRVTMVRLSQMTMKRWLARHREGDE